MEDKNQTRSPGTAETNKAGADTNERLKRAALQKQRLLEQRQRFASLGKGPPGPPPVPFRPADPLSRQAERPLRPAAPSKPFEPSQRPAEGTDAGPKPPASFLPVASSRPAGPGGTQGGNPPVPSSQRPRPRSTGGWQQRNLSHPKSHERQVSGVSSLDTESSLPENTAAHGSQDSRPAVSIAPLVTPPNTLPEDTNDSDFFDHSPSSYEAAAAADLASTDQGPQLHQQQEGTSHSPPQADLQPPTAAHPSYDHTYAGYDGNSASGGHSSREEGVSSAAPATHSNDNPTYGEYANNTAGQSGYGQGYGGYDSSTAAQPSYDPAFGGYSNADVQPSYYTAFAEDSSNPAAPVHSFWEEESNSGSIGYASQSTASTHMPYSFGPPSVSHQTQRASDRTPQTIWSGQGSAGQPAGRPAVPLVCLGFGGRVVTMHPRPSPVPTADGQRKLALGPVCLHSTQSLLQSQVLPVDTEELQLLKSCPFTHAGLSKDKLKSFVQQKLKEKDEGFGRDEKEISMFWKFVAMALQTKGYIFAASTSASAKEGNLDLQLSELFRAGNESKPHSRGLDSSERSILQASHNRPPSSQVASQMQTLLLHGDATEALRVAVEGKLWGPALVLSQLLGEVAFKQTAQQMVQSEMQPSSALASLLSPEAPATFPEGDESSWQDSLALLVANRRMLPADAIQKLGDKLGRAINHSAAPAQLCYVVRGVQPSPYSPEARFCLPLADHKGQPRTYASLEAIQRGLLLELISQQGQKSSQHIAAAMLPYRILYAFRAAEYGLIAEASQLCANATATFNSFSGKIPPGLLVARAAVNDLQLRLQQHAQSFNIHIATPADGSMIRKASRWLDRGLSKLIGIPNEESDQPDATRSQPPQAHRRSSSVTTYPEAQPGGSGRTASGSMAPGHLPKVPSHPAIHSSPGSTSSMDSRKEAAAPRPPEVRSGQAGEVTGPLSMRGLMSRVGSLTTMLAGGAAAKGEDPPVAEEENKLYYDNELKMWRIRGEPPPKAPEPVRPPPMAKTPVAKPPPGIDSPPRPSGSKPPHLPGPPHSSPGSRYVDTLSSTQARPPGHTVEAGQGRPAQNVSPGLFVPPGASGQKPPAQKFFVPPTARSSAPAAPAWGKPKQDF